MNLEPHLMAITAYWDCIKNRRRADPCGSCGIPGSGLPIPNDLCILSIEEMEKKIEEHLDALWKIHHGQTSGGTKT